MSRNWTGSIKTCTMHYGVQDPTVKSGFLNEKNFYSLKVSNIFEGESNEILI